MGMLVGVAVGWELARELDKHGGETDRGHPLSWTRLLRADRWRHPCPDRPVPDRQPEGGRRGRRRRPRPTSSSRTGTPTTSATSWTSRSAPGAQCVAIVELAGELGEEGVENVADPNIGGTVEFDGGWVRLTPAWHTSTTPNGHREHAGRARDQPGRQDRLPPRRHRPLLGPRAASRERDDDRRRADVHRRPLHDGPPRRRGRRRAGRRRHGDPLPLRHVPADRDRRRGVQVRRRVADLLEVVVLEPGDSHSV